MDYITAREDVDRWGITRRRVHILCVQDRIEGAQRLGNMWAILKNAEKPVDRRTLRYKKIWNGVGRNKV
ncbi:hypothetical protein Desgi_1477 [Desulfoscipio gibsoniae DSM 7213]|uniref:Helix-turn-helix domain-containing protein n=1 Tax=Desulfoscipio gibsoniae DSM 7213 TaxID=767817 RepID=R4KK85_9FIRM|nr:hypothetical protein Desgi_1477 [Desulfoscipio gibsoniae DSM 7213]